MRNWSMVLVVLIVCLPCAIARSAQQQWITYEGTAGPGKGRTIVLISGDEEYRSEEALPQIGKILSVRHGFTCHVLFAIDPKTGFINPDERTNIPGLEHLDNADLMVIATRFRDLPDDQMRHIDRYINAGKPIVGLRTATHAFALKPESPYAKYSWNNDDDEYKQGFGRQVLGETWIAHHGAHGRESTRGVVAPDAKDHPIARGVGQASVWGPTDVYRVRLPLPQDSTPIFLGQVLDGMTPDATPVGGDKNNPLMPIAWTKTHRGARVFTSTLGAATDFVSEGSRRMLVQGIFWTLGMEARIPEAGLDVDIVGTYRPTAYGFGGYRRGMRVIDHALEPQPVPAGSSLPPGDLRPNERIVVVGNTFAERMALSGWFDAVVHASHPDHRLVIRHIPWSGDEVGLRPRERNVPVVEELLARYRADVVFLCFGMVESFRGASGLGDFEGELSRMIDRIRSGRLNPNKVGTRIVLVSPIRHEDLGAPWPTGDEITRRNTDIRAYVDVMRQIASSKGIGFVDLFSPTVRRGSNVTSNGIHPTDAGCRVLADAIAESLGWKARADRVLALRSLAHDKVYHHRLLYRPTNTEYVWGRRHEPFGIVNFPPEMEQLDRMVHARERALWDAASLGRTASGYAQPDGDAAIWEVVPSSRRYPADTWSPDPVEAKGTETSLGETEIKPPSEFVKAFELPDGYTIECFASEEVFPELANPLAMTFDAEHRLWVLCAPTYPHLLPGDDPRCKLIILEDRDQDGRADECTVVADRLYVPTGFAVDVDCVYVGQAPDLWRYWDADGDDKADRRELVLTGFSMPDSHHQISAFEWEPNGGFVMHEGVFGVTGVETPRGVRRARDAAIWRFDPRKRTLDLMSHCGFSNPWGHVFDDYGRSILADASGGDNFAFSHVIMPAEYPRKPSRTGRFLNRGRPTAGCELIASSHFPQDVQGTFVVNQSIGFHGTRWDRVAISGSGWGAERMPQDLIACDDVNFRPVGVEIGPDGALYVCDWCNPIVGHMQYSVRDPRRDHSHGRIWRVRAADRPLLTPPDVVNAPVAGLLDLLRIPERNTRQLARRRLQRLPADEVFPELAAWLADVGTDDPIAPRLLLESLWLHQAHGRVDVALLERVFATRDAGARGGAIRVLRHWIIDGAVPEHVALPILEQAVRDASMRVRIEGVLACGFVPSAEAAAVAAIAAEAEMDDGLQNVLEETLAYLAKFGDASNDVVRLFELQRLDDAALLSIFPGKLVDSVVLRRASISMDRRRESLVRLANGGDVAEHARVLLDLLQDERDDVVIRDAVGPMLVSLQTAWFAEKRPDIVRKWPEVGAEARAVLLAAALRGRVDLERQVDPDVRVRAVSYVDASDVPAAWLARMKSDVIDGRVDPNRAIAQIVRVSPDRPALFDWLASRVDEADASFDKWGVKHELAMAALSAMHRIPASRWPEGYERFATDRPTSARVASGERVYVDDRYGCAKCHGLDGRGEGGFPPLASSPWVLGNPERAAGIVVHGLEGPMTMPGGTVFSSSMAPLGSNLTDQQVADVLTYIRRSFGNHASPVDVVQVTRARAIVPSTEAGPAMWQTHDLLRRYPLADDHLIPLGHHGKSGIGLGLPLLMVFILGICVPLLIGGTLVLMTSLASR